MTHNTERFGLPADEESRPAPETRHATQPRPTGGLPQAVPPAKTPEQERHTMAPEPGTPHTAPPGSQHSTGPERSGVRMPGTEATGRDAASAAAPAPAGGRPADAAEGRHTGLSLLPPEGRDALSLRMQQAVTDFVENPRHAVEEADSAFDRIVADLTQALEERRRELRAGWQGQDSETRTEELRVALQRYRDAGEQLLRI
ncbi:hypothetical protein [Streptomyces sp. B1I3]|uniref:hypothetical protein n=1 Tax=Streptomyces sp. B1I3 TaxID=3042264 RepID=UPI00277E241D|nr:hypothetical protein [Streptomyces sp. B1I3]MDQ0797941.1 hypothetical protein [Streptomyces sp. B1I3]